MKRKECEKSNKKHKSGAGIADSDCRGQFTLF